MNPEINTVPPPDNKVYVFINYYCRHKDVIKIAQNKTLSLINLTAMNIEKNIILGNNVILEPLNFQHLTGLEEAIKDGELWRLKYTDIPHPDALNDFLVKANTGYKQQQKIVFAIIDKNTQKIAGCTGFYKINMQNKKAIIGPTFIAKSWQKSYVNTETKYLLLKHAFEHWKLNRVEFHCDVSNIPSRNAIRSLGAIEEGFLRQNRVMADGRVRDTVIHSIIQSQWSDVMTNLHDKMQMYKLAMTA